MVTAAAEGGGTCTVRRHSDPLRCGLLSHSSSSRNTDAVAPELARPCPDEQIEDAAPGMTSVECRASGTMRSEWAGGGGGGGGAADDVLVLVLDDGECCLPVQQPIDRITQHHGRIKMEDFGVQTIITFSVFFATFLMKIVYANFDVRRLFADMLQLLSK